MGLTYNDFGWLDLLPARGMVARLTNAVEAVKNIHQKRNGVHSNYLTPFEYCTECHQVWPCATISALEGAQ